MGVIWIVIELAVSVLCIFASLSIFKDTKNINPQMYFDTINSSNDSISMENLKKKAVYHENLGLICVVCIMLFFSIRHIVEFSTGTADSIVALVLIIELLSIGIGIAVIFKLRNFWKMMLKNL